MVKDSVEKIWYVDIESQLVETIAVRERDKSIRIDVYENTDFIFSANSEDIICLNKEEMRKIYEFLKRFYE